MNIPKRDYNLLTSMVEFHFKFSEYVRENISEELFYRAVDYAKTYAKTDGVSFEYWHEDNKKFLTQLLGMLLKTEARFERLVLKMGDREQALKLWMEKKGTTKDDPLQTKSFIKNFIHHARQLSFDDFDQEDWMNFVKITKYVKDNPKFIEFALSQIARVLGTENDFYKELKNEA